MRMRGATRWTNYFLGKILDDDADERLLGLLQADRADDVPARRPSNRRWIRPPMYAGKGWRRIGPDEWVDQRPAIDEAPQPHRRAPAAARSRASGTPRPDCRAPAPARSRSINRLLKSLPMDDGMRIHDDSRRLPESACPTCGHKLDAVSQVAETGALALDAPDPKPGDVSVCIRCGSLLRFGLGQTLHKLTDTEFLALARPEKAALEAAQRAVRGIPWEDH